MKNKIVKIITLSAAFLNIFLINTIPAENVYNVQANINSSDIPTAAKIFAESVKATQSTTSDFIKTFKTNFKVDSKHFENPTFHLGESSQKTLLEFPAQVRNALEGFEPKAGLDKESREALLAFAQAIIQASANLSKTGNSIGLNPETVALARELFKNFDPSKFKSFKLSDFLDKDPKVTLQIEAKPLALETKTVDQLSTIMKQAGFVMSGICAGALSIIISSLLANKHISQKDAEFTKADGVATCATVALAVGAWALITYSDALAGAA